MSVVDTSWLVALHVPNDAHHADAVKQAEGRNELLVSDVILNEFLTVIYSLAGGRTRPAAARKETRKVLEGLLANPAFRWIRDADTQESRKLFLANELSYADSVAIRTALARDYDLLTFDARQRRMWNALRPPEFTNG